MHPLFSKIIGVIIKRQLKHHDQSLPENQLNKKVSNVAVELKHLVHDIFFIAMGILSASFGLKGFLLPNSFIDGGVTGD